MHTDRLSLRGFVDQDRTAMNAIYADPAVMRWIDTRGEDPGTWVAAYIRQQAEHGYGFWAIEERATRELIGEAGLARFDGRGPQLELGYLLRRDRWGLGLATEAARVCRDAAFAQLHAPELFAVVDEGNDASLHVLAKLGFTEIGRRRQGGRRQRVLAARPPAPAYSTS